MKPANFSPRSRYAYATGGDVAVIAREILRTSPWKEAVRVATVGNGSLATDFEPGDIVDGVALARGDRFLARSQSNPIENGIYVVAASGAPVRAADFDEDAEIRGALVPVREGSLNAGALFRNTNTTTVTVGTTAITFTVLLNPAVRYEPVVFDNAGTPEIVFFQDAAGVWDIVMHEVSL